MKINLDRVPRNLDEAVLFLKNSTESQEEIDLLKENKGLHFGLGMYLRNNWSLREKETVLVRWFRDNLGIIHADDISGTILETLSSSLKNEEFNVLEHVRKYKDHWKNLGIDPLEAV